MTKGTTGRPASRAKRFATSLSMATAEPMTDDPTYGTSASSSAPWTVPSSPLGPCSTGNMTSTWGTAPFCSAAANRNTCPLPPGTSASGAPCSGMARAAAPVPAPFSGVAHQPAAVLGQTNQNDVVFGGVESSRPVSRLDCSCECLIMVIASRMCRCARTCGNNVPSVWLTQACRQCLSETSV